jgi:hypothetical protein
MNTHARHVGAPLLTLIASLALAAGCGGDISGSLVIDGQPATVTECASGEHQRAPDAVEVTTSRGTFLLTRAADGQAQVSYLVSGLGSLGGIPLPLQRRNVISNCGPMTLTREDYMQNGVYPLSGSVTLDCGNTGTSDPDPHTFRGSLTFDRCR